MHIPEDILSTLTEEQKKRVEAAKSADELLAIAKETGQELSPDQLDEVSGGIRICWKFNPPKCQNCPHDGNCHKSGRHEASVPKTSLYGPASLPGLCFPARGNGGNGSGKAAGTFAFPGIRDRDG